MKKNFLILLTIIAAMLTSCYSNPEYTIGTNTLTVGDTTFLEIKKAEIHDIYTVQTPDSICTLKTIKERNNGRNIEIYGNCAGNDTIVVFYVRVTGIYAYGEEWRIPITVLPKE